MKTRLMAFAATLCFVGLAWAEDEKKEFKAHCPLTGKAAKESVTADFNGKKVYFCCENCQGKFTAEPKKFTAKANYQLAETKQIKQTKCPISKQDVDADTAIKVGKGDVSVAFCCNNCQGKVKKAKANEQIDMVFKDISKTFADAKN